MKKIGLLILLSFCFYSFTLHKYYIALTEIEYVPKEESVQMIMNTFMDDIEVAIQTEFGKELKLTTAQELPEANAVIYAYLQNHFKVTLNGTPVSYRFLGKETEGTIVYFYLEIKNIKSLNSIEIQNDMLVKNFPDQQNLIKVKIGSKRKSLFLNKKNDKGLLKF